MAADTFTTMSFSRRHLLGMELGDARGEPLGRVVDTYPYDGGGELELVVLRLCRFGERRMLPAADLKLVRGRLFAPYTRAQIEDSPPPSPGRHTADDPDRARWYWYFEDSADRSSQAPAGELVD